MEIETLKKSHKKEIIIGISLFVIIAIVLVVRLTFAKYNLVKSIKIAEGTINYKVPDFKIMAMYKNDGNGDIEINTMPESGYVINESKSYCTLDNVNKDTKAKLFTNELGQNVFDGISKYDKCYLYFDKQKTANETILGSIKVNNGTPDFSKTSCAEGTNNGSNCEEANSGVYKANDNDGESYYFRGGVTNNYVKFANKYWRIIRINGDGSIRLIYDGTSAHQNGEVTTDSIAVSNVKWSHKDARHTGSNDNAYTDDNMYVGFKYTANQVHGLGTKSNALQELETWYTSNLSNYANKIDTNAGFCGDRTPSTSDKIGNDKGGTGTTTTYYGAYIRLITNKSPILTCANTSDLYTVSGSTKGNKSLTYPIGLISADEVAMAGGVWRQINYGYYLYNGQNYYSLSPYCFDNPDAFVFGLDASVFGLDAAGDLDYWHVKGTVGVRPVINLKAAVTLTGKGTASDPYVVI